MDDVVVVDILHADTILIDHLTRHLIPRGIDGNIEMVALTIVENDRIALLHLSKCKYLGFRLLKLF